MSKLFDTLEKIRENEGSAAPPPVGAGGPSQGPVKARPWLVVVLGVGIVAIGAYAVLSRSVPQQSASVARQEKVLPSVAAPPVAKSGPVPPVVSPSLAPAVDGVGAGGLAPLNALGTACVERNQHWRGIYYLRQAHAMAPERLEPLVNLAVAYAELGLYRQANAYLVKAVAIDPGSEPLQANLRILHRANLLEQELDAAMVPEKEPRSDAVGHKAPAGRGARRP